MMFFIFMAIGVILLTSKDMFKWFMRCMCVLAMLYLFVHVAEVKRVGYLIVQSIEQNIDVKCGE